MGGRVDVKALCGLSCRLKVKHDVQILVFSCRVYDFKRKSFSLVL